MYRVYATFGTETNPTPRWIWVYTDERVATDAPSDQDIKDKILEVMTERIDRLAEHPQLLLDKVYDKCTYSHHNIAIHISVGKGDTNQVIWDRYLMPALASLEYRVFA